LGAPGNMLGPDLWGVARLGVLALGLSMLTAVLLRATHRELDGSSCLALVALPALLVVTVPKFAVDLARFGAQEPLLIGCMAAGGSMFFVGLRAWVGGRRDWRVGGLVALGLVLWVVGVYQKEISICVLVLAAFLVLPRGRQIVRAVRGWDLAASLAVGLVGVVVVLPLAHVGVEVVRILRGGELVYYTKVQASGFGSAVKAFGRMTTHTGSPIGPVLLAVSAVGAVPSIRRRQPNWAVIGLVATALAALAWSAQTPVFPSRYYLPTIALLAVACALTLAAASARTRWVAAVVLLIAAVSGVSGYRRVDEWASQERAGVDLVNRVVQLKASGCPVVVTGMDLERGLALPVLVDLHRNDRGRCPTPHRAYEVHGVFSARGAVSPCLSPVVFGSWNLGSNYVQIARCRALAAGSARFVADHLLR
jgi:hypothetical protein